MPLSTHTPVVVPANGEKREIHFSLKGGAEATGEIQDDGLMASVMGATYDHPESYRVHARHNAAEFSVPMPHELQSGQWPLDNENSSQALQGHLQQDVLYRTEKQSLSTPERDIYKDASNNFEGYSVRGTTNPFCAADLRLLEGTCAALLSPTLSEANAVELCESLQSDLLQDSHPALLLPLHWCESRWKQQRNGRGKSPGDVQVPSNKPGDDAEVQLAVESVSSTPCLLYSLTVTLERHVDPERDVSPAVVLAVLQAQIVLLGRLRETLLLSMCDSDVGTVSDVLSPVRKARVLVEVRKNWGVGSFGTSSMMYSDERMPPAAGLQGRQCSCLAVTDVKKFLKPVFVTALRRRVLLLQAQAMQLVTTVLMLAHDVATLLQLASLHSTGDSEKLDIVLGILGAEELVHAGQELRATASEIFPPQAFHSSFQPSHIGGQNCPVLFDSALDPRQDAWLDIFFLVAQLVPPPVQQQWLAACDLQNLVLFLLRRTSVPLCRPQVLPTLLQLCGCCHQDAACFEGSVALKEASDIFRRQPLLGLGSAESAVTETVAAANAVKSGLWAADVALCLEAIIVERNECFRLDAKKSGTTATSMLSEKCPPEERTCYYSVLSSSLSPNLAKSEHFYGDFIVLRNTADILNAVHFLMIDGGGKQSSTGRHLSGEEMVQHILRDLIDAAAESSRHPGRMCVHCNKSSSQNELPRFKCCSRKDHMEAAVALVHCASRVLRRCFAETLCSNNDRGVCDLLCCPDFLYECCLYGGEIFEPVLRRAARQLLERQYWHPSSGGDACHHYRKLLEFLTLWNVSLLNMEESDTELAGAQSIRSVLKRRQLVRNLFSISASVRQSAASELRLLSGGSPMGEARMPLAADPVSFFVLQKVEDDRYDEWQQPVGEILWQPGDVEVLCSAAINPRLDASTRIQSLRTLRTIILSNNSEALPFIRKLVASLFQEADLECCSSQSTPARTKAQIPSPAFSENETVKNAVSLETDLSKEMTESSTLLQVLVKIVVNGRPPEDVILAHSPISSANTLDGTLLITAAVQFLSLPLQILPADDPLVFSLLDLYESNLVDCLPRLIFFSPSVLSYYSLQLLAHIVFHPADTFLLRHRMYAPSGDMQHSLQQHSQAGFRELSLIIPTWLASKVRLPLPIREVQEDSLNVQQCGGDQISQFDSRSDQVALHVFNLAKSGGAVKSDFGENSSSVAPPLFTRSLWPFVSDVRNISNLRARGNSDLWVTNQGNHCQLQSVGGCTVSSALSLTHQWRWCPPYSVLPRIQLENACDSDADSFISDVVCGNLVVTPRVAQQLLMPSSAYLHALLRNLRSLPDVLPHVSARGRVTGFPRGVCKPDESVTARDDAFSDAVKCTLRILSAFGFPEDFFVYSFVHTNCTRCGACSMSEEGECLLIHPCAQGVQALRLAVLDCVFPFIERVAEQLAELTVDAQDDVAEAVNSWGTNATLSSPTQAYVRELNLLMLCLKLSLQVLIVSKPLKRLLDDGTSGCNVEEYKCKYCRCCASVQRHANVFDIPQILGNLIGISTDLPFLRRVVLQVGVHLLPCALGPWCDCRVLEDAFEDIIGEGTVGACRSAKGDRSASSMVLLQLQIQQLVSDAALASGAEEALSSFQEQQPLADTLSCLNICIRTNGFSDVAAAAANANAAARSGNFGAHSWKASQLLEDPTVDSHPTNSRRRLEHERLFLLQQMEMLLPLLHAANPRVRVRAWQCIEGCISSAKGILKSPVPPLNPSGERDALSKDSKTLVSSIRRDVLRLFYDEICPRGISTLQRVCHIQDVSSGGANNGESNHKVMFAAGNLHEDHPSPCCRGSASCGWLCVLSPESQAEISVAASCLATVRTFSGPSPVADQGDEVAAAAGALDKWVASDVFFYKILRTLLGSASEEPQKLPEFVRGADHQRVSSGIRLPHSRCVVKARIAALKLVYHSAETRAGIILNLLWSEDARQLPVNSSAEGRSVLGMLIRAVNPSARSSLSLLHTQHEASIISAAVAAAGTPEAEVATRAAVGVLGTTLPSDEVYAASWALKLLLSIIDASVPLRERDLKSFRIASREHKSIRIFVQSVMSALVRQVQPLLCASLKVLYGSYYNEHLCDLWPLCCCEVGGRRPQLEESTAQQRIGARDRTCRWHRAASGNAAALVHHILLQLLRIFAKTAPETCSRVSRRLGFCAPAVTQLEQSRILQGHHQIRSDILRGIPQPDALHSGPETSMHSINILNQQLETAISELWAQPTTWLLISFCVNPLVLRRPTSAISVVLAREACTLACCILLLSYERAVSALTGDLCTYPDDRNDELHHPFCLPNLLPPLPSRSLNLYQSTWAQGRYSFPEGSHLIVFPPDPNNAQGIFRNIATALLDQLQAFERQPAREGRVQVSKITTAKRQSSATSPRRNARCATFSMDSRGFMQIPSMQNNTGTHMHHANLMERSSLQCSSPENRSIQSSVRHCVVDRGVVRRRSGSHIIILPTDLGEDLEASIDGHCFDSRGSLVHVLADSLLLLFAGHPVATTAAAWTQPLLIGPPGSSDSRENTSALFASHIVRILECTMKGASASSILNFAASFRAQQPLGFTFLRESGVESGARGQDQWNDNLKWSPSWSHGDRSPGSVLMHRVVLLLQLVSAGATCTEDALAASAAADSEMPFGTIVSVVRSLWRASSLQQGILSLVLHFMQRCVSPVFPKWNLVLTSGKSCDAESEHLSNIAEQLHAMRLYESGILDGLIDSVIHTLSSCGATLHKTSDISRNNNHTWSGTKQQKLPPRVLCSVLLLLQKTVKTVQDRSRLLHLAEGISSFVRLQLQQLLQRSSTTTSERSQSARNNSTSSCDSQGMLGRWQTQRLHAALRCLTAIASVTIKDRRTLAAVLAADAFGQRRALRSTAGVCAEKTKEAFEDFTAPLLLDKAPIGLVCDLLEFFCSTAGIATSARLSFRQPWPGATSGTTQEPPHQRRERALPQGYIGHDTCDIRASCFLDEHSPTAFSMRLLLQQSPSFAAAAAFLLAVRLSPDRCWRTDDNIEKQHDYASALYFLLLLLKSAFLKEVRSACRLKQRLQTILSALGDWEAELKTFFSKCHANRHTSSLESFSEARRYEDYQPTWNEILSLVTETLSVLE